MSKMNIIQGRGGLIGNTVRLLEFGERFWDKMSRMIKGDIGIGKGTFEVPPSITTIDGENGVRYMVPLAGFNVEDIEWRLDDDKFPNYTIGIMARREEESEDGGRQVEAMLVLPPGGRYSDGEIKWKWEEETSIMTFDVYKKREFWSLQNSYLPINWKDLSKFTIPPEVTILEKHKRICYYVPSGGYPNNNDVKSHMKNDSCNIFVSPHPPPNSIAPIAATIQFPPTDKVRKVGEKSDLERHVERSWSTRNELILELYDYMNKLVEIKDKEEDKKEEMKKKKEEEEAEKKKKKKEDDSLKYYYHP